MKLGLKVSAAVLSASGLVAASYLAIQPAQTFDSVPVRPISVSTTALPLEIYCPGALVELGGEDGTDLGSLALVGSADVWVNLGDVEVLSPVPSEITEGEEIALLSNEQQTQALSANQTQVIKRDRMRGVAAVNCSQGSSHGYFSNGISGLGQESILKIANPGNTEAQITITTYLKAGQSSKTLTLAPGATEQLSLTTMSNAESNFAVEYQSNGPAVHVVLQTRTSRGLAATGVELSAATQASNHSVIPGLEVFENQIDSAELGLFNPQLSPATVRVTAHGIGVDSDVFEVQLEAGELQLAELDLPVGEYLIEIQSDLEVVSSIWSQRLSQTLDYAWLVPAEMFAQTLTIPVPQLESDLVIGNPGDEPISVAIMNAGQYQSITIAAKSQASLAVQPPVVQIQSQGEFVVSLQIKSENGYSVIAPTENENLGSDLQISVR